MRETFCRHREGETPRSGARARARPLLVAIVMAVVVIVKPTSRDRAFVLAVTLITLAVAAFFVAHGAMCLVGAELMPRGDASTDRDPTSASHVTGEPDAHHADGVAILARNMFDADGLANPVEDGLGEDGAQRLPTEPRDNRCEGGARLVGAVVDARDSRRSLAAIADATGRSYVYRAGMELDGRAIVAIQSDRVVMSEGERLCELAMFAPPETIAPSISVPTAVLEAAPSEQRSASIAQDGITRSSETRFALTREAVDDVLAHGAELMRMVRVAPASENGRVVGTRLTGIRGDSVLGQIGLRNGDTLRAINGYDISSPDDALAAYAALRSARDVSIALDRGGAPLTLEYQIR